MRTKTCVLLLLLLLGGRTNAAPFLFEDFQLEEAQAQAASTTEPLTVRVSALSGLAQYWAPHFPKRGIAYAQQAISLQSLLSDQDQTGDPFIALAECHYYLGQLDSMALALKDAKLFDRGTASERFAAVLALTEACYFIDVNELDSAERGPMRDASYYTSLPEVENRHKMLAAFIAYRHGDYERAMQAAIKGHRGYWEEGDSLGVAAAHNTMGLVLFSIGFYSDARKEFDNGLHAITQWGDSSLVRGALLSNKAMMLRQLKQPNDAYRCLKEAERIARLHGATGLLISALNNLGELRYWAEDHAEAIHWYQLALAALPEDDLSIKRAILDFNVRNNALCLMEAEARKRSQLRPLDEPLVVQGRTFTLGECIDFCLSTRRWLLGAPYREFDLELAFCLNRAYHLSGQQERAVIAFIEGVAQQPDKDEINKTMQLFDAWRKEMHELITRHHFMEETKSISWKGLLIPFLALLVFLAIGRSPGKWTIAVLFIAFGLFTTAWIEIMLHHWLVSIAGSSEVIYWILALVIGVISFVLHMLGHHAYRKVLDKGKGKGAPPPPSVNAPGAIQEPAPSSTEAPFTVVFPKDTSTVSGNAASSAPEEGGDRGEEQDTDPATRKTA